MLSTRISTSLFCSTIFFLIIRPPPTSTLFPYTTLFRSVSEVRVGHFSRPVHDATHDGDLHALEMRRSRSEEHTSELQSHSDLVCRLLLEKKNVKIIDQFFHRLDRRQRGHRIAQEWHALP